MKKSLIFLGVFFFFISILSAEEIKNVEFKPYGFVELYGWYNDADINKSNLLLYVKDEEKGDEFSMSIRKTRLGLNILFPSITTVSLKLKGEVDFSGNMTSSGTAEGRPQMRMRHAYADLNKNLGMGSIGILVGNTWSPATPNIFPSGINPSGGWGIGNVWQRMPQITVNGKLKFNQITTGIILSATRPMSGNSANKGLSSEVGDAGDYSLMPIWQGQIFTSGKIGSISFLLGIGGAYGKENYEDGVLLTNGTTLQGEKVDVQLLNVGLKLTHKYAGISGKAFMGKNLNVFGVMGADVIKDDSDMIIDGAKAKGFWIQGDIKPVSTLYIAGGFGVEDPDDEQEFAYNSIKYSMNSSTWAYASYTFLERFLVGVQWTHLVTETKDNVKLTANSYMFQTRVSF